MKKFILAILCCSLLSSTITFAADSKTDTTTTEVSAQADTDAAEPAENETESSAAETPDADPTDAISLLADHFWSMLPEEQKKELTDLLVDILVNEDIMNDATFLLDSATEEQKDAMVRLVFNIVDLISANYKQ